MKKSRTLALLLALALTIGLLPAIGLAETAAAAYVNSGKLKPLYEEPDDGSAQIGEVQKGQVFTLLSRDNKWAQVAYTDPAGIERRGYIKDSNLKESKETYGTAFIKGSDEALKAPLRKTAKKSGTVLAKYFPGVLVQLLETPGERYTKVQIGNQAGFVETALLHLEREGEGLIREMEEATVQNPDGYSLSLREAPNYKSEKFRGYQNGTAVLVLGMTDEFAHVLTPDGRTGFMMSTGLSPAPVYADLNPEDITERPKGYTSIIDNPEGGGAHLRRRGSTASESMGLYRNGTEVVVVGGTAWWKKVWVNGHTGYMMAKLIRGFVPSEDEVNTEPQFDWNLDNFQNPPGWNDTLTGGDGVKAPEGE